MINTPAEMTPISLYYAPKDAVISIGMTRNEIIEQIGEERRDTRVRFGKQVDVFAGNLLVYFVDDIAVQFEITFDIIAFHYYLNTGMGLFTNLGSFYRLYNVPDEMKTKNPAVDISDYHFEIRQSSDGFTTQLLPDFEAFQNFRKHSIDNNDDAYYMSVFLGWDRMIHFDIHSIIIGKANVP